MPPTALALIEDHLAPQGASTIAVKGELDLGTTPALREWLGAATDGGRRSAVLDLSDVTFMDASALHALCDEQERLLESGEALTVVCSRPSLLYLFDLIELGGVLDIVPTRSAAADVRPQVRPYAHLADWLDRHPPAPALAGD